MNAPLIKRELVRTAIGASMQIVITPELLDFIRSRFRVHKTIWKVSQELGIDHQTLRKIMIKNDIESPIKKPKGFSEVIEEVRLRIIKEPKQEKVKLIVKPYDPAHIRPPSNAPKSVISFNKPKKTAKDDGITTRQIEVGRSFARGMQKPD